MHKMSRMLGLYSVEQMPEAPQRLETINEVFRTFLQAMEYHQAKDISNLNKKQSEAFEMSQRNKMTELDEQNAHDILVIAIETLYEVKMYDFSVLNPVNFQMIIMCEHGLNYYPESVPMYSWLTKLYGKLGLVKIINAMSQKFPTAPQAIFSGLSLSKNPSAGDYGSQRMSSKLPMQTADNLVD